MAVQLNPKSWLCSINRFFFVSMKDIYIKPQFVVIDLDATSIACGTTDDHVYDTEPLPNASVYNRDRIRIQTDNDVHIGEESTIF